MLNMKSYKGTQILPANPQRNRNDQIVKMDIDAIRFNMTEEEREEERREILERFGANVGDLLKRARLAREKQRQGKVQAEPMDVRQLSEGMCSVNALYVWLHVVSRWNSYNF